MYSNAKVFTNLFFKPHAFYTGGDGFIVNSRTRQLLPTCVVDPVDSGQVYIIESSAGNHIHDYMI